MKALASFALVSVLASSLAAAAPRQLKQPAPRPQGSECGLIDFADDLFGDDATLIDKPLSLDRLSDAELRALPTLIKQQIVIAAMRLLTESAEKFQDENDGVVTAVRLLAEAGSEANYASYRAYGSAFSEVVFYPGDNRYGAIFQFGSRSILALIEDSSVVCAE